MNVIIELFKDLKFKDTIESISWNLLKIQFLLDVQNNVIAPNAQLLQINSERISDASHIHFYLLTKLRLRTERRIEELLRSDESANRDLPVEEALSLEDVLKSVEDQIRESFVAISEFYAYLNQDSLKPEQILKQCSEIQRLRAEIWTKLVRSYQINSESRRARYLLQTFQESLA